LRGVDPFEGNCWQKLLGYWKSLWKKKTGKRSGSFTLKKGSPGQPDGEDRWLGGTPRDGRTKSKGCPIRWGVPGCLKELFGGKEVRPAAFGGTRRKRGLVWSKKQVYPATATLGKLGELRGVGNPPGGNKSSPNPPPPPAKFPSKNQKRMGPPPPHPKKKGPKKNLSWCERPSQETSPTRPKKKETKNVGASRKKGKGGGGWAVVFFVGEKSPGGFF